MGILGGRALIALTMVCGAVEAPAEPKDASAVYWPEQRTTLRAEQSVYFGGTRRNVASANDVHTGQIRARARRVSDGVTFADWYFRNVCKPDALPTAFCRRKLKLPPRADFSDSLILAPDAATTQTLDEVAFPVLDGVPPVAYLKNFRRRYWLGSHLEPTPGVAPARACSGACSQFAGIWQASRNGGVDVASIVQSGPNVAVIGQHAEGWQWNIASVGQWGACNKALVLQGVSPANNSASVFQAGYGNSATVFQH
ncbi:hypothetical protein Rvan_2069 [Rhodomicrobium vannielii ATCC 17100]|uniref:Uncharacterized protein n=1 Tax=Rhodomicrobium vannielii (strain ATCC 17100 / DSM 162 / LMG 4299 / NCIMB 10020 / ATH 3.1.1) TaxID=648757 RepID=E3I1Z5_RHOVT|nr:hypothetical protein [Rhodomicrobium vannielii]ADP71296.1 hypothetical protein Rvan_2069 [Rhodomicrobium vannielii ATCC 17100]